ncbi:MAG TPA: RHS repeat-associated core domain-containing protein, partial [Thermoguttaceae bacterium]|nr:RHS repeat-associated core domain-containing protein [Thermoguttaceae bacterium]
LWVTTEYLGRVQYLYDVFGQRVGKQFPDEGSQGWGPEDNTYFLTERGHTVILLDDQGQPRRRRLYAPGVDQILAVDNGPAAADGEKIVWTLTDQQGTVRDIAAQKADESFVTDRLSYGSFGAPLDENLDPIIEVRYAGRDFDRETDLSYNRARYYEPSSGRFLSPDPIGFSAGDINLYRYAGNSPTNATDPTGHFLSWATSAIGAGIGAAIYGVSALATGEFSWGGFGAAAGLGFTAGAVVGATIGDPTALGAVGVAGAIGAGVGAVHGGVETYAGNHNAGPLEYTIGIGSGALSGLFNPTGEIVSAGSAVVGGTIDAMAGGEFFGTGFQAGGLVGGLGSAFRQGMKQAGVTGARRAALWAGARSIAPEAIGAGVGFGAGCAYYGNLQGGLHGATLGMFGGSIVRGVTRWHSTVDARSRPTAETPWNIWDDWDPKVRGRAIEKLWGRNLPKDFPGIDHMNWSEGVATSFKSVNLADETYQTASKLRGLLKRYVNSLDDFDGARFDAVTVLASQVNQKVLRLAIPPSLRYRPTLAQSDVLHEAVEFARKKGIRFAIEGVFG